MANTRLLKFILLVAVFSYNLVMIFYVTNSLSRLQKMEVHVQYVTAYILCLVVGMIQEQIDNLWYSSVGVCV